MYNKAELVYLVNLLFQNMNALTASMAAKKSIGLLASGALPNTNTDHRYRLIYTSQ